MRLTGSMLVALALLAPASVRAQYVDVVVPSTANQDDPAFIDNPDLPGTFSVIGRDPATGQLVGGADSRRDGSVVEAPASPAAGR
jgi:hypothetical protein